MAHVKDHMTVTVDVQDADQLVQAWAAIQKARLDPTCAPRALQLAGEVLGSLAVSVVEL